MCDPRTSHSSCVSQASRHTSRLLRFLSRGGNFAADAQRESPVDYARPYGVVVMTGLEQDLVAIAYYVGAHGDRAEAALAIADA